MDTYVYHYPRVMYIISNGGVWDTIPDVLFGVLFALWNTSVYAWRVCVWYASHVCYCILLVHHYPRVMYIISHVVYWWCRLAVMLCVLYVSVVRLKEKG